MRQENELSEVQREKWQEYPEVDRTWWTPTLSNYVAEALHENVPQKVMILHTLKRMVSFPIQAPLDLVPAFVETEYTV